MALSAAGLGGHVVVGLNTTRRGGSLLADIRTGDCQLVLTDDTHAHLLDGLDLGDVRVIRVDQPEWFAGFETGASAPSSTSGHSVVDTDLFMLIFTSGTSGEPKAVRITHEKVWFPGRCWPTGSTSPPTTSATSRCRCSTRTRSWPATAWS